VAGNRYVKCVGPSYHLQDKKAAVQRSVNLYPQKLDDINWMMESIPGFTGGTLGGPEMRGSKKLDSRWFVVAGDKLYLSVSGVSSLTEKATLSTSTGYVGMAVNQSQLAIVDGAHLYIYNYLTDVFTEITAPGWRGSDDVYEMDGYFVFVDPDTDQFYLSAIDDGTSLDALDFSSADSSPDDIITHRVSHRQLFLFGKSNSTEIWINSGDLSFPFVRYQSYTIDVGCVGKRAAINADDTLYFIGKTDRGTGIVYRIEGNQPQRVSTLAVEKALLSSADLSVASMWTYQDAGHEFIGIEVPDLETTWVYDAALQQWHERGRLVDGEWAPMGIKFCVFFEYGPETSARHFVAYETEIGYLNNSESTLNFSSGAVPLVRERTWPHMVAPSYEPISYRSLELGASTGEELTGAPDGANVTLEISNDGGITFGPPLLRSLGAVGRHMQRVRWLGLGASRNRVFRIRCSDAVPFAIHSAYVEAE
jgi:Phage stabilisation protein